MRIWAALLALSVALGLAITGKADVSFGQRGAVATVSPLATDAAIRAMEKGGNAVDAIVAAALTLGVVDGFNSGLGGGCFLLIHTEKGEDVAIDGREMAPAKATRDMFVLNGKADPELSLTGSLAIGVPGSLAAYEYALSHFGKLKLSDHLLAAAKIASRGFTVTAGYAARVNDVREALSRVPEARAIFLKADGNAYSEGETLRQPDLAKTYRAIAEQGIDWFYRGEFAQRVEEWMRANAGVVSAEDFRDYHIVVREPVRSHYRGYEIVGFPPPSSGGVHVAQILNTLEHFDLKSYPAYSAGSIHLIGEAMKLAFADRAYWLGDPDFVSVPRGLVSEKYAETLAKRISLNQVAAVSEHGPADQFGEGAFHKHTTHFSAADASGNWVACTATINTTFGSKVVIPGTGVVMNNQMDDFSAQPGTPNYFGLVGAEANAIAPGKRPLSSMSPTIVLKDGKAFLSLGAAGGPTIISQTVVNLINILDYGMNIDQALAKPRIHQQWRPDELKIERIPDTVRAALEKKGHTVREVSSMGAAQMVIRTKEGFSAAADPRVHGKAAAW